MSLASLLDDGRFFFAQATPVEEGTWALPARASLPAADSVPPGDGGDVTRVLMTFLGRTAVAR